MDNQLNSHSHKWMHLLAIAVLGLITSIPSELFAQQLEEIFVTATRRGESNIQITPISVTALDEQAIDKLLLHDLGDIAIAVPNLVAGNAPAFNSVNFSLRGVGQTSIILYQEAPVGVSIDDFVVPHVQTQALEPFDIESIEVLRGPQGTLFGKNTTAGVINVRTKRPVMGEKSIEVRAKYAEFDTIETRYAVNYGLTDTFAVRAAGVYQKSDGYYQNGKQSTSFNPFTFAPETFNGDGRDLGGDDVFSGRFKALWQPTENFTALFQYEIIRDNGDSPPVVNTSSQISGEALPQFGLVQPGNGFNGVTGDDPFKQAGISDRCDVICLDKGHEIDVDGFYLNIDWDIGNFTLHSVTGFRDQESRLPSTFVGETRASLFDATRDDNRETFQQEIRINSNLDGPVNFILGGFYQENDVDFCVTQALGLLDFFGPGFAINGPTFLGGAGLPPLAVNTHNDNPSVLCNSQDATAVSVFGDISFDFTDRVTIGAGWRLSYEKKKWVGRAQTLFQFLDGTGVPDENLLSTLSEPLDAADFDRFPSNVVRRSKSWTKPSWRANVGYEATDNIYLWVTLSRSVKSGAFNDQTGTFTTGVPTLLTNELQLAPVNPEFANSREIGIKADLFNNRLRLNMVFFDVDYEDAQRALNAIFPIGPGVNFQETRFFNAAELDVRGIEFEGTAQVTDNLVLSGNFSWQEAEFRKFEADANFNGVIDPGEDLSGRPVNRAPDWTGMVSATYSHSLSNWGKVSHNILASYEEGTIFTFSASGPAFDARTDDRLLVNWSSTFTDNSDKYFIRVFGKNLTDENYITGNLSVAGLWTMTSFGAPRQFGVEVGAKFDF